MLPPDKHLPVESDISLTSHWEQLVTRLRPELRELARASVPDQLRTKVDESDLVQETLLQAYRRRDQYEGTTDTELTAWLRSILEHQLIDAIRFYNRTLRSTDREVASCRDEACEHTGTPSEAVMRSEAASRVRRALNELPDDYREVLLLRQEEDLSFPEIALRMSRTPDAVRMLWGRAIMQLGKLLKPE